MTSSCIVAREEADWPRGSLVDVAITPDGGRLSLVRFGLHYEILIGEDQLMGSWAVRSEQALATLVADRLGVRARRVLIGGLGMGFTLGAARAAFPRTTEVVVAELIPAIVEWARGPLAGIVGDSLDDPRVSLEMRDVHDVIDEPRAHFDAILLDVDNGPQGLIDDRNERIYCNWGLRAARSPLREGGILAVWSAFADDDFTLRLYQTGFDVETVYVPAGNKDDSPLHAIWLATA